jgi:hypothetical protein
MPDRGGGVGWVGVGKGAPTPLRVTLPRTFEFTRNVCCFRALYLLLPPAFNCHGYRLLNYTAPVGSQEICLQGLFAEKRQAGCKATYYDVSNN